MRLAFPFNMGGWVWDWGWGLAATIAGVIVLAVLLIPWFLFLLNLNGLLEQVDPRRRAMAPGHVWLNFIPVFNLGWFLYTVVRVRDSVRAEYAARGWAPEGDFAYSVGLIAGVLGILSVFGIVPFLRWAVSLGALVCWIVYWLKTSEFKHRLQLGPNQTRGYSGGQPTASPPPPPPPPPPPTAPTAREEAQPSAGGEDSSAERAGGVCAVCGTPYAPTDVYCRTCGIKLPQ